MSALTVASRRACLYYQCSDATRLGIATGWFVLMTLTLWKGIDALDQLPPAPSTATLSRKQAYSALAVAFAVQVGFTAAVSGLAPPRLVNAAGIAIVLAVGLGMTPRWFEKRPMYAFLIRCALGLVCIAIIHAIAPDW